MQRTLSMFIVLSLVLLTTATPADAHQGFGGGFNGNDRLEGEDYDSPETGCDPDYDGTETRPASAQGTSGGYYGYLPNTTCGLVFDDVVFDADRRFTDIRLRVDGSGSTTYEMSATIYVSVDSVNVASASIKAAYVDGFVVYPLSGQTVVPAGVHDVRLHYSVSPAYANFHFDYADSEVVSAPPPPETIEECRLVLSAAVCEPVEVAAEDADGEVEALRRTLDQMCRLVFSGTVCDLAD